MKGCVELDFDDWEVGIHFLDEDGRMLPTNVRVVPLVEFLKKPYLWSFESEKISGVCLKLKKR